MMFGTKASFSSVWLV
uniref:Uncharacterized protein n=1 Tax=Anguilla anguilla TaxID=7936 RepID=A0A0E9R415_ANGAN